MNTSRPSCAAVVTLSLVGPVAGQISWQNAAPLPAARENHCGAFDLVRNRLVIHGGSDAGVLGDTWEYDGVSWAQVTPTVSPGPRWAASMAFDPVTGTTILFGGAATIGGTPNGETWRWNGTTWSLLQPPQSPPALLAHAMATDLINNRIVLFGGRDTTGAQTAQTWTFDGTTWSQLGGPQPPPRCCHDLALDLATGNLVLYGGWDSGTRGDTWELVANTWIQRTPAQSPGARWGHRMAFMVSIGRVVLHGSSAGSSGNDTWGWDGSTWQLLPLTAPYPARHNSVLQTNLISTALVMAAGRDAAPTNLVHTLSVVVPGALVPSGSGCPGPSGTPQLSGAGFAWIGAVPVLRVAPVPLLAVFVLGASNTVSGGIPLPLPLGAIGMPGCTLQVSLDTLVTASPVGGVSQISFPIPLQTALVGIIVYAQAGSLDPGANPLGLTISNAVAVAIGGV